jgi:cytoskeletal protein CcmA (bactofilin family)
MKTHSSPRLIAALIITASFIPFVSLAAEFRTGDSPMYEKSETVNDDLYLLGGSVTSSGDLRGDLITFGGNILINGTVLGDIAAGGGNISILSQIHDDVRVAGGTVIIQGGVTGDILAAGGQITISSPKVGGDVTAAGGVVRLDAPDIAGDVRLAGGDVRINSAVNGNLDIQAESITLGPKARIAGTFTYTSPKQATMEAGAVVSGETKYTESPDVREAAKLGLVAFFSVWFVAKMFMVFSGALVIGYVFQRYSDELVARVTRGPLMEFARGVVFFIVTPVVSVLLLFTVIGIAFGVLGILGYIAMLIVGAMLAPILIGSIVHKALFKQSEYEVSWKTILTGTVLYFVVNLIPFVGPIITFCVVLIGIGATLAIKGKVLSEWR